jgi:hypothetical protein
LYGYCGKEGIQENRYSHTIAKRKDDSCQLSCLLKERFHLKRDGPRDCWTTEKMVIGRLCLLEKSLSVAISFSVSNMNLDCNSRVNITSQGLQSDTGKGLAF